ncbi:MAG TPA: hypothetical protein VIZ28_10005 [Chitinophagaceae bacterium]
MKSHHQSCLASLFSLLFISPLFAQDQRAFNQNAARSNRGLSISFSPLYSVATNSSSDSLLFRGSGAGFGFGADYFFGMAGISFSSGFISSSPDDATINNFLKRFPFSPDELIITKAKQQNMYMLFGPSIRYGKTVQLYAHAKGGLFINNSGLVSIQQKGAQRAVYRNESTAKSIYPGFLTGLRVEYSTKSDLWSFGIGADYMNTKSEVNNYDARRGGGIEGLKLSRNITDIVTAITIRYNILSPRDHASGQSTGKRQPGKPKYEDIKMASRDNNSGMTTGKRSYQPGQPVYGNRTAEESCGPVTQRTTNPDGSTEEMTFACPADAAAYAERISMNVTVPKQTQGATFGEKVNAGLHAAGSAISQGASRNIISGRLSWPSSGEAMGIVTNRTITRGGSTTMNSQTSSTRTTPQSSFGTMVRLSAREKGSGMATGKRSRETGSGMSTGRRQYEPIFADGQGGVCDPCIASVKMSAVKNNPLYEDKGQSGSNPMHQAKGTTGGGDDDCDGIAGMTVSLVEPQSGAVIAKTITESCGNFFFANVPDGDYVVKVNGTFTGKKGYDVYLKSKTDLLGKIEQGDESMQLLINTSNEDDEMTQKAGISTSRSNIRTRSITIIEADPDGDGEYESTKVLAELSDGTTRDISAMARMSKSASVKKVTVRGWDPEKKQAVTGSANPSKEFTISIDSDNKAVLTNQHENGTKEETSVVAKVSHHPDVVQFVIPLDEPGTNSRLKTKTKSNQSNDREAAGDMDEGEIWSPRSNIKILRLVAADVDGDGTPEMATAAPYTPGGENTGPAMKPGNPIGGLTIKGGKNPGGNLTMVQTDGNGEFEYTDLEAGDYTFTVEQRIFIEDETFVSLGGNTTRSQDHNSSRSNKTNSGIANDPGNGGGTKVQDHNSSRSNKTSSVISNGPGNGGGAKSQDHNSSRSNKTNSGIANDPGNGDATNTGPVKWIAPEALQRTVNTSRSNIKNILASLDKLEEQLDNDASADRYLVNTSRSNIKNQRMAIYDLRETISDMQYMDKNDAMDEISDKATAMNTQFLALQETLKAMGRQYTTVSNVLKTKHDTAMNSIRNMK